MTDENGSISIEEARSSLAFQMIGEMETRHAREIVELKLRLAVDSQNLKRQLESAQARVVELEAKLNDANPTYQKKEFNDE